MEAEDTELEIVAAREVNQEEEVGLEEVGLEEVGLEEVKEDIGEAMERQWRGNGEAMERQWFGNCIGDVLAMERQELLFLFCEFLSVLFMNDE